MRRFGDPDRGGFFFTASDAERLVVARKELDDNPTPSGSSLLATVLLRLGRLRAMRSEERLAVEVIRLALPRRPPRTARLRAAAAGDRPPPVAGR